MMIENMSLISMCIGGIISLIIGIVYLEYKEVKEFRYIMGYTKLNILQVWIKKHKKTK